VTQEQFAEFRAAHENHTKEQPLNPVDSASYEDAALFCQWTMQQRSWHLLKDQILDADDQVRDLTLALPSEAQWEYACRAGSETDYWMGDGEEALREVAWFGEDYRSGSTHPVVEKLANDFGLYDVHGNVWEWCRDAYEKDIYRKRISGEGDPEVMRADQADRVLRGGSWFSSAAYCRSACRNWDGHRPGDRSWDNGFRLGLFPGPDPDQSSGPAAREDAESRNAPEGGTPGGSEWR
jgi:formylglycine-generating enzyme required for sulfatase activity